jgi:DNA repair protein RadC
MSHLHTKEQDAEGVAVLKPKDIVPYFKDLEECDQETFWVVSLDAERKVIRSDLISMGGPNYACVSPNLVFRRVLQAGGVAMIVLHNHPSGNPAPSREDEEMTAKLKQGANTLEIKFLDHLIIALGGVTSIN